MRPFTGKGGICQWHLRLIWLFLDPLPKYHKNIIWGFSDSPGVQHSNSYNMIHIWHLFKIFGYGTVDSAGASSECKSWAVTGLCMKCHLSHAMHQPTETGLIISREPQAEALGRCEVPGSPSLQSLSPASSLWAVSVPSWYQCLNPHGNISAWASPLVRFVCSCLVSNLWRDQSCTNSNQFFSHRNVAWPRVLPATLSKGLTEHWGQAM